MPGLKLFHHFKELNLILPIVLVVFAILWVMNLVSSPALDEATLTLGVATLGLFGLVIYLIKQNRFLDEQQARFEASIDNINIGFVVTDTHGEVVSINPAAKRILFTDGATSSPSILRNTSLNRGVSGRRSCKLSDLTERLKGSVDLEFQLKKCLVERKTISIDNVPFHDLSLHLFITPIVVLEDNDLGLDFIGAVILVEDRTNQKIVERSKDEFFSIASHELKTPLGVIRSNAQMIKSYFGPKIADKAVLEMVDDIYLSAINLIGIVNDFLDLSRLEQGRIQYVKQAFDLVGVVDLCIAELSGMATEKGLFLIFQKPLSHLPMVEADPDKAKQVTLNLISNAIKYTEHGEIRIEVVQEGNMLKLLVSDTGQGIAQEQQKLLFRKFQAATKNPLTRDTSLRSTGLGLYISKMMVEGMGGEIKLEKSAVNIGSTFSFTLPIAKETVQSLPVSPSNPGYPANFLQ
jgi:signal transduction histidine kinase